MIARLKLWAAGLGLVIAALAASWFAGRKAAQTDTKVKELKGYVKTRQRMDEADDAIVGDDPAAARLFLAERAKRSGDL